MTDCLLNREYCPEGTRKSTKMGQSAEDAENAENAEEKNVIYRYFSVLLRPLCSLR